MWKPKRAKMPAPVRRQDGLSYYFAYGSNLNIEGMRHRCPAAKPFCALELRDAQLVFRGVADVVFKRGAICPGGVWLITKECEKALDRYEGVAGGMYTKRYFTLSLPSKVKHTLARPVLFYKMRERGISPPSVGYLQVIEQGYHDFELDIGFLEAAVEHAWEAARPTPGIRRRYHRKGYDREFGHVSDLGSCMEMRSYQNGRD
jgi:hypothetical protein